jgi:hypothetical protein
MTGALRSATERFLARAYHALLEAAAINGLDAKISSTLRRRRTHLKQGGLFAIGVFVGVLVGAVTDLDRAYGAQPLVVQAQSSRRVARRIHKDAPRGSSSRAIPTLDVGELPSKEE